ncbi:hypothetical protein CKAH01_10879 [Colletotrichum kahawae]|uniref:Uncharacterized protein n=1 Tax=Colletotrichum kahawae TaxID=34407 RepID=A0AAD9XV40_COLKA|nr:hypothetical protein CKAH01_10879 [Colletotrichum kahawae]
MSGTHLSWKRAGPLRVATDAATRLQLGCSSPAPRAGYPAPVESSPIFSWSFAVWPEGRPSS